MQSKLLSLLNRLKNKRHVTVAAVCAVVVVCGGLLLGVQAGAFEPATHHGWVISVDGVAVAGAVSEAELTQAYDALVASYQTEDTTETQVLNVVEIAEGDYSDTLPQNEAVSAAIADAVAVRTVETCCHTEVVSLNSIIQEDDTMYEGEIAAMPGNSGRQTVETTVMKINGETYLTRDGLPEVEEEAVAPVLIIGTKERPEYVWPTHGSYTGNFGIDIINGANREHKGIDIANAQGTNIYAARAGVVVYAGWNSGGYGNLIIIEHDNGTQTYYAHNVELLVSVGDEVEQGEHIAEMGRTGRVTGVHCHFELRRGAYTGLYSGTPIDPMKYLSFEDF